MRALLLSYVVVQLLLLCISTVGISLRKNRVTREFVRIDTPQPFVRETLRNQSQTVSAKEPFSKRMFSNLKFGLKSIRQQFDATITSIQDSLYKLLTNIVSHFSVTPMSILDVEEQHTAAESNVSWAGIVATSAEMHSIVGIRKLIDKRMLDYPTIKWYRKVKDAEILRFLRAQQGNVGLTWKMITEHVAWRSSMYGADSPLAKHNFLNSPLHHEVFWAGVNRAQCPILVIRTQVHNATYYDHDLKVYESFIISQIEKGRKLYGVGTQYQMCVLLDRGGHVLVNGQKKTEAADMTIVPRIVELAASLRNTLQANYPDILHSAKIAPSSWFFSLCYRMVSATLDAATLSKFEIIRDFEIPVKLHTFIDPALLPAHLGGSSIAYTSDVRIEFNK